MGTSVGVSNLLVVTLSKKNDTLSPGCHQLLVLPPMGVELGGGTGILTGLIIPEDVVPHVLTGASLC